MPSSIPYTGTVSTCNSKTSQHLGCSGTVVVSDKIPTTYLLKAWGAFQYGSRQPILSKVVHRLGPVDFAHSGPRPIAGREALPTSKL